jgi:hypothetical protein
MTTRCDSRFFWRILVLVLVPLGCKITVVSDDGLSSPYRSEHFHIHFEDTFLTAHELETIALRKERHLREINRYLGTDYDGVIEVVLTERPIASRATRYERTHESVGYVLDDTGHETAHVVALSQWGRCDTDVLQEGLAVAAEVHENGRNAIDRFMKKLDSRLDDITLDSVMSELNQDMAGEFKYTSFEYAMAGAFIEYLRETFGMSTVKRWYRADVTGQGMDADTVRKVFEQPMESVLKGFSGELKKRTGTRTGMPGLARRDDE